MRTEVFHIVSVVDRLGERRETYRRSLAQQHRISPPLLLVLRLLESRPGLTMVELARLLGVSVPTMQSRINRLEELRLISRSRSSEDRRKVLTSLTRKGRALLGRAPLAGAGRLIDALEKGEVTPQRLRRIAEDLARVERLLFPEEAVARTARKGVSIWRR